MAIKLLIATGNTSKFARYKRILSQVLGLEIVSPGDIGGKIEVVEDGQTAQENALKKATVYAQETGIVTLAVDEVLYIGAFGAEEQLILNVRRCIGREATDKEVLDYFLKRLRGVPCEKRTARWLFAICIVAPDGESWSTEVIWELKFSEKPSLPMMQGYPLSSILLAEESGKTFNQLTPEEREIVDAPIAEKTLELVNRFLREQE